MQIDCRNSKYYHLSIALQPLGEFMTSKRLDFSEVALLNPKGKWNPIIGLHRIAIRAIGLRLTSLALTTSIMLMIAIPGFTGCVKAASQPLNFTVSDESNGMTASFAANVEYPAEVNVAPGAHATISYTLSSASGSVQIAIPLADLGAYIFYPLSDQTITVPIPATPIGSVSIPVSSYVSQALGVPLPASIASINLIVQSSIKAFPSAESGASSDPLTTIDWVSWGGQSVLLDTGSMPSVDVISASFGYVLSYGVVASVLGSDFTLIPMTALSTVAGSQTVSTHIVFDQGASALIIVAILAIVAVIAVLALALWRRGKKEGKP